MNDENTSGSGPSSSGGDEGINPQQAQGSNSQKKPGSQTPGSGGTQNKSSAHGGSDLQAIPEKPAPTGALSTGRTGDKTHHFVIPPHPNTTFDEAEFLKLLEGSISLTLEEKQKVIDAIPRLSIEQINELIKIFKEEKQKFAELEAEYGDDVAKLKKQRESEFELAKVKEAELTEAEEEAAEAEALKRKLMGGE